jgi:hypothetical protein
VRAVVIGAASSSVPLRPPSVGSTLTPTPNWENGSAAFIRSAASGQMPGTSFRTTESHGPGEGAPHRLPEKADQGVIEFVRRFQHRIVSATLNLDQMSIGKSFIEPPSAPSRVDRVGRPNDL